MPAQVEYWPGSIFDHPGDLLVIPSSAGGTITPEMQQEIRKAGLPFPSAMPWGTISVYPVEYWRWSAVAYAASVTGQSSSEEIVEKLGWELGRAAAQRRFRTVVAPLLGAGSGDLPHRVAADALTRGFKEAAPESAVLVLCIRSREVFEALTGVRPPAATADVSAKNAGPQRHGMPSAEKVRPVVDRMGAAETPPPGATAASTAASPGRKGVFISYSHADAKWLERLRPHLPQFEDETLIWSDKDIQPGADWRGEIREKLAAVKVAVLLVSAQFLASRFIAKDELPPLLDAADEEGVIIIPVHISASRFDLNPDLSRFQSANDPRTPLMRFRGHKLEEELDRIGRTVEAALKR